MTVVRLELAYDGTAFHGWAAQPGVRTVAGVLQDTLNRVLGGVAPRLSVAGRTDAGVHARGQVASFERPGPVDLDRLQRSLNSILAPEVVILVARRAPDGFDARRSATGREYVYRIRTAPLPDPFTARFEWHRPVALSLTAMRAAARSLMGEHDFASFCRAPQPAGASTVRHLRRLSVLRRGGVVEVRAEANAFLHQMVRSLVGTLAAVGEGRREPGEMAAVLLARSRSAAGPIAPAQGLTLVRVRYGRGPRLAPGRTLNNDSNFSIDGPGDHSPNGR